MNKVIVVKRDGREKRFNKGRIEHAVRLAMSDVNVKGVLLPFKVSSYVKNHIKKNNITKISITEIESLVVQCLSNISPEVSNAYTKYRNSRNCERELNDELMSEIRGFGISTNRDNANVGNNFSSKLLNIASTTNKRYNLLSMPEEFRLWFENGEIYYHDLDSFNLTTNCLQINLRDALANGFNTGYGMLREPQRIESAAALVCILLQASQNDMFGGQSISDFDTHLAKYVGLTREKLQDMCLGVPQTIIEENVEKTVEQAMQSVVYNLNSMHSRAGSQTPFSSICVGYFPELEGQERHDAAMICRIFLQEYEKGLGKGEQPIFPSIIFRVKDGFNANPEDEFYELYQLACRVTAKRMNPTYVFCDAPANEQVLKDGCKPTTMGCRTVLHNNINGQPGSEKRGNLFPVTINIPRVAIKAMNAYPEDFMMRKTYFFLELENLLERTVETCQYRYDILKKLKVKDLPFAAGQHLMMGSEGLDVNDSIEPIMKHLTIAIGFFGLAEVLVALTGKHHGECENSRKLGLEIVKFIYEFIQEQIENKQLNYSCYFTPAETCGFKMMNKDKKEFGIIKGVTDKEYYTNSVHIPVGFPISFADKLKIEGEFHKYGTAGRIAYVELDDTPNQEVVERIITYTKNNTEIAYLGINFRIRYCCDCGASVNGEMTKCPNCESSNIQGVSRITGYLALDERFGPGKDAERRDRKSHDGKENQVYRDLYQ